MIRTVEATIDASGRVHLDEDVALKGPARALVTILEDDLTDWVKRNETAILSEAALAEGWTDKEADEAWKHLEELPDLDRRGLE